jgi:hypothetical protein
MKPVKQIKVKVFTVGNKSCKTFHFRSPNGRVFTPEGVEHTLQRFAAEISKSFPHDEYTLKQLSRNEFNFCWVGKRVIDPGELLVGGMALGQIASVEVGA